jgi:CHAD domain-containing protein
MRASIQSTRGAVPASHRALLAELEFAIEGLGRRSTSDAHIHEIRKALKRARAALRLLRGLAGVRAYRRDNAAIRDAARPLTAVRDGKVLLQTLRDLKAAAGDGNKGFASQLRSELRTQRLIERRRLTSPLLRHSAVMVRQVHDRISLLAIPEGAAPQATEGLKHAYKRARQAFREVAGELSDDRLHEWRKQTKYFASQLEILEPLKPRFFAKSRKRADRLTDALGQDHDLVVLAGWIRRFGRQVRPADRADGEAELLGRLVRRREKLKRRVLRLGRRLFSKNCRRYRA